MSRLSTAIAYVIPQSEQQPHCHAPNGGMCRDCVHWASEGSPNLRVCPFWGEVNRDWSCVLFERAGA